MTEKEKLEDLTEVSADKQSETVAVINRLKATSAASAQDIKETVKRLRDFF